MMRVNARRFFFYTLLTLTLPPTVQSLLAEPPSSGEPPKKSPTVVAVNASHDFGTFIEGNKLRHVFQLMNVGTRPVEILKVAPDCGCIVAENYAKVIEPGGVVDLPFTLDTTKLLGPFVKWITVVTNDPDAPQIGLTLQGEGKRLIEIIPTMSAFGRIREEKTYQNQVTITNRDNQPMTAKLADLSKKGAFDFELVETVRGYEFKLFVLLRPPFKEGTLTGAVTISTSLSNQPHLTVNASAVILPRLEIMPQVLYIGGPGWVNPFKGESVVRFIDFLNHGSKPVRVKETIVDDPKIRVATREVDAGRLYRVQVEFPSEYSLPAAGRTIQLTLDDLERPTISIPVRMMGSMGKTPYGAQNPTTQSAASAPAPDPVKRPVLTLVGQPAPDIRLTTLQGARISNDEFKNHPATVLNFIAVNCPFCQRQLPEVERLRAEYQERGIRFVNVIDSIHGKVYSADEARTELGGMGINLEIALDPDNLHGVRYKINAFPALVLIGSNGLVEGAYPGARAELSTKLRQQLDALLVREAGSASHNKR